MVIWLDLSTVFDCADCEVQMILLRHLEWVTSYWASSHMVVGHSCFSIMHALTCGILKNSILSCFFSSIHVKLLGQTVRGHGVQCQPYTNDTQSCICFIIDTETSFPAVRERVRKKCLGEEQLAKAKSWQDRSDAGGMRKQPEEQVRAITCPSI